MRLGSPSRLAIDTAIYVDRGGGEFIVERRTQERWKKKWTRLSGWLCLGCALCAAFWLRPGVNGDRDEAVTDERSRMTRSYGRDRDGRGIGKKNPRMEFEAARKKGMTEEGVREVVDEYFKTLAYEDQPDRPVEEVLRELRERRLSLYLDALAEGFQLTEEQKLEAQAKLPALAAQHVDRVLLLNTVDRAWELSLTAEGAKNPTPSALTRSEQIELIAKCPLGRIDEGLSPWELCELDERQKEMIGYKGDAGEWIWVNGGEMTLEHGIAEKYRDLNDPFTEGVMGTGGVIFPLGMRQVERLKDYQEGNATADAPQLKSVNELERVKLLSRAQLKTLLLFNSEIPDNLMKELEE
jgi:hypothetical protein